MRFEFVGIARRGIAAVSEVHTPGDGVVQVSCERSGRQDKGPRQCCNLDEVVSFGPGAGRFPAVRSSEINASLRGGRFQMGLRMIMEQPCAAIITPGASRR